MTGWRKRTIMEMAREVKMPYDFVTGEPINIEKLEAFAELVREDEREMLAQPAPYMAVSTDRMSVDPHTGNVSIGTVAQPAPVQEPVGKYTGETWDGSIISLYDEIPVGTLLYTTPLQRTWVGLTDEEFNELYDSHVPTACYALLIEEVEAKLKEKNT